MIIYNKQNGQIALLITLVILVAILSIGLGLTLVTIREMKMASNIEESAKSFAAADAGTEYALWETNKGDPANLSNFECGTGVYSVGEAECCFELTGNEIKSTGKYQKIQRAVSFSQGGGEFMKTLGEDENDWGYSIATTSDGGYIVTGDTRSFGAGDYDLLLLKFDSSGELVWAKTVGGSKEDWGYSVAPTSDGRYIVTGYTNSFGAGNYDLFLLKFDSSGNLDWAETVGGASHDFGSSVFQTSDGGYIVTGDTRSFGAGKTDLFLLKFDSSGNLSWAKTVGGDEFEHGYSVSQISDGGYIVTGQAYFGATPENIFLLKFDSSGNLSWVKTVGGSDECFAYSVAQTSDGGYIVTGETGEGGLIVGPPPAGSGRELFLLKFDSSGNLSWAKTVGGEEYDKGDSVSQTSPDGGYIVTGYTNSFGAGKCDVFFLKFDSSGNLSWAKTVGEDKDDLGSSVSQTSDGGYIVSGGTRSFGAGDYDLLLLKFDSSGDILGCPYITDQTTNPDLRFEDHTADIEVEDQTSNPNLKVTDQTSNPNLMVTDQTSNPNLMVTDQTSNIKLDTQCCTPGGGVGKFEETRP